MSSNIRVVRICQHCGSKFEAKTTVTKYCSDQCAKRAYKAKLKNEKIEISNKETTKIKEKPLEELRSKEFLTVRDVAILLNSSRQTVYNLIGSGYIPAVNIKLKKTLIRREDIDKLFNPVQSEKPTPQPKNAEKQALNVDDCYNISDVLRKYKISEKALYELIKREDIPKFKRGSHAFVPKDRIDSVFMI